jgi:hypothetical protein
LNVIGNKTFKKDVIVSAVDSLIGTYIDFKLNDMTNKAAASAVIGSAAVPVVFPPKNMSEFGRDVLLVDGGFTAWNNNLISGIQACLNKTGIDSEEQIEVDVIRLAPAKMSDFDPK